MPNRDPAQYVLEAGCSWPARIRGHVGKPGFSDQEQAEVVRRQDSAGFGGHAFNLGTREAEPGTSLGLPAQLDLHGETLLQKMGLREAPP